MTNVLVQYRPNTQIYGSDCGMFDRFHRDVIMDIGKLVVFVAQNGSNPGLVVYSDIEAQAILSAIKYKNPDNVNIESYEKYSFYDTEDELELVQADSDEYSVAVTIYLND